MEKCGVDVEAVVDTGERDQNPNRPLVERRKDEKQLHADHVEVVPAAPGVQARVHDRIDQRAVDRIRDHRHQGDRRADARKKAITSEKVVGTGIGTILRHIQARKIKESENVVAVLASHLVKQAKQIYHFPMKGNRTHSRIFVVRSRPVLINDCKRRFRLGRNKMKLISGD